MATINSPSDPATSRVQRATNRNLVWIFLAAVAAIAIIWWVAAATTSPNSGTDVTDTTTTITTDRATSPASGYTVTAPATTAPVNPTGNETPQVNGNATYNATASSLAASANDSVDLHVTGAAAGTVGAGTSYSATGGSVSH